MERAKRLAELWVRRAQLIEELVEIDKQIERLGFWASPAQPSTVESNGQPG